MKKAKNDIETVARALCRRQLADMSLTDKAAAAGVDRYWPFIAAEIEAGIIDHAGNRLQPFDYDASHSALLAWQQRRPS